MTDYDNIYKTYQPKLKVFFNKQVKDKDIVDDLTQEVLFKVWSNLDTYDKAFNFSTWLYTIAFNHLKNYFKSLKDTVTYTNEPLELEQIDNPEDILIASETESTYYDSIDSLDKKFLECYTLREVEGLSYKEISSQLDIPEGTAKSRVKRARDHIKKEIL